LNKSGKFFFDVFYTPIGNGSIPFGYARVIWVKPELVATDVKADIKWFIEVRLGLKSLSVPFFRFGEIGYFVGKGAEAENG